MSLIRLKSAPRLLSLAYSRRTVSTAQRVSGVLQLIRATCLQRKQILGGGDVNVRDMAPVWTDIFRLNTRGVPRDSCSSHNGNY